jgi:hypothetical protein
VHEAIFSLFQILSVVTCSIPLNNALQFISQGTLRTPLEQLIEQSAARVRS